MELPQTPLEDWTGRLLPDDRHLLIKRDDLLPFPFAGNKVRKLLSELNRPLEDDTVVITVGSVHSNHCRTTALMCARRGLRCHLILHKDENDSPIAEYGRRLLDRLGASYVVVHSQAIHDEIESSTNRFRNEGRSVYFIEGGCHTPAGVEAYRMAVSELMTQLSEEPAYLFLASGTGATQAGLALGCMDMGWSTAVVGVSVARSRESGLRAVNEAIAWFQDPDSTNVVFVDDYRAGGYGLSDRRTLNAVEQSWKSGLPADQVYTGKAIAGLIDLHNTGMLSHSGPIVFWHTGGLFQGLFGDS